MSPTVDDLRERIRRELDEVKDPCSVASGVPLGLTEMGLVKDIDISDDGHVKIGLRLTAPTCHMIAFIRSEAITRLQDFSGVTSVEVTADQGIDWRPSMMADSAQAKRAARQQIASDRLPLHVAS